MFKSFLLCFFGMLLANTCSLAQQTAQDVVQLKDGSVVRGTIIEQVPNVSLKIQTDDGKIFSYEMANVQKIYTEEIESFQPAAGTKAKSPTLSFLLSFLIPGGGQYYNGQTTKGIIQTTVYVGGAVTLFGLGYDNRTESRFDPNRGGYYDHVVTETTTWWYVGLGLAGGAAIWSMIDAPITASRMNKKANPGFGHLIEIQSDEEVLGFDLGPTKKGVGAQLTYHF